MFRPRCSLKNSANSHGRLETRVSAIDSTPQTAGIVFDVAIDLRKSSPTFGCWVGVELSASNKRQLWMVEGFARGFVMTSNSAEFLYKTTDEWVRELERSILRDDPAIRIDWSLEAELLLSCKDKAGTLPDAADVFAGPRTPAWRDVFSTPMFQLRKRQRRPRRSG